jgi:cytochrome oxidase Cu insertion factor (SCO1/SenC/PrrC family)
MMKTIVLATLSILLSGAVLVSGQQSAPSTPLKVGDPAPDFTLSNHNGEPVSLSSFKGKKNVVLAFYVLAFTGG